MSSFCYLILWLKRWLAGLCSVRAGASLLSSFGTLWLAVEVSAFFLEGTEWPSWIRDNWVWFGFAGVGTAGYMCRPVLTVTHKLHGRDVHISVTVADIFKLPGALVIGSNTTFDTRVSKDLISEKSIQGAFTRKYYDNEAQMDAEIEAALREEKSRKLHGQRVGKDREYSLGTCARLAPKGATAYLVAIASINEHGVASGSFEGLQNALASLWTHIGVRGTKDSIRMPVLGSGFSRLAQPREELIRTIIQSFIAACSESVITDHLTIVIHPKDMAKNGLSLEELGEFIGYNCKYSMDASADQTPVGTPA